MMCSLHNGSKLDSYLLHCVVSYSKKNHLNMFKMSDTGSRDTGLENACYVCLEAVCSGIENDVMNCTYLDLSICVFYK